MYDVRQYGAVGDGITLDTPAINRAIETAAAAGGGTVHVPAGTYLCYSIRLKSNITLELDSGATILAAGSWKSGNYDPPEPNIFDPYEDFGHSHWHNSLIWGVDLHNVSIVGHGLIYGRGLSSGHPPTTQPATQPAPLEDDVITGTTHHHHKRVGSPDTLPSYYSQDDRAEAPLTKPQPDQTYPNVKDTLPSGIGNKSISLKNCHDVTLRDVSILYGGHFGILATGVDNFTIDNVKIDTNRDGMDIDCCENVRISNCSINSPNDDGLCLKSSFGLGLVKPTDNVTITNCYVTGGYVIGTLLDGTFVKHMSSYAAGLTGPSEFSGTATTRPATRPYYGSHPSRTGRIKFGTESNGGFTNITISNCILDDCEGLALETVDGGPIENVTINNIVMRDITGVPIFIRLGNRARGPFAQVGTVRHVNISDIVCENVAARYACVISGIPDHNIEDLTIRNVRLIYPGDSFARDATTHPAEIEKTYPEPTMFRAMPAYGFFFRHVDGLELDNVDLSTNHTDPRPPFWLEDVSNADFFNVKAPHPAQVPTFHLIDVEKFSVRGSRDIPDARKDDVDDAQF
jgi:polygalacturonase